MSWKTKAAIGVLLGLATAEAYRWLTTRKQKYRWEGFVKTHHGEAGVIAAAAGALTKSPTLMGMGIGLAIHDRDDASKWFKQGT